LFIEWEYDKNETREIALFRKRIQSFEREEIKL
jgi:hypothetical protein